MRHVSPEEASRIRAVPDTSVPFSGMTNTEPFISAFVAREEEPLVV
jgi:hypothetical protein